MKQLINFPNYFIQSDGKVFSSFKNGYLIPYKNKWGYLEVKISNKEQKARYKIHRLVAKYYINNIYNNLIVNHIDGNKSNNHYTNLEWCTSSENNKHAHKLGLNYISDKNKKVNIEVNGKPLIDLNTGVFYDSINEACRILGFKHTSLSSMLRNVYHNKTSLVYA